jgi:hypothetical protein
MRADFVGTAVGVTIFILLVVTGLLTISGSVFIVYDLIASHSSWGEKLATLVNLPNQALLAIVVTALPTLVQLAYLSAKIAGLAFADNPAFKWTYRISLVLDTALDTLQMQQGSIESVGASLFVALILFGALSEFLTIFSGSIFVGLLYRVINEDGLLDMAIEDVASRTNSSARSSGQNRGSQNRGRQN